MNFDTYKFLKFSRRGRVLTICMSIPATRNAINEGMHHELSRVFVEADDDPESDILIFTGEGDAFSAGGDIGWLKDLLADHPKLMEISNKDGRRTVFSMLECEKPIIARVPGPAVGLGATLALFSDIVFASDNAVFADPHVLVGLVAGDGGSVIWSQLIGPARAKEYLMTGQQLTAADAERIGLINHCVPAAELEDRVNAFTDRLARGALKAIRGTKKAINVAMKPLVHSAIELSFSYEFQSAFTDDYREAVEAFSERRKPVFKGC